MHTNKWKKHMHIHLFIYTHSNIASTHTHTHTQTFLYNFTKKYIKKPEMFTRKRLGFFSYLY